MPQARYGIGFEPTEHELAARPVFAEGSGCELLERRTMGHSFDMVPKYSWKEDIVRMPTLEELFEKVQDLWYVVLLSVDAVAQLADNCEAHCCLLVD